MTDHSYRPIEIARYLVVAAMLLALIVSVLGGYVFGDQFAVMAVQLLLLMVWYALFLRSFANLELPAGRKNALAIIPVASGILLASAILSLGFLAEVVTAGPHFIEIDIIVEYSAVGLAAGAVAGVHASEALSLFSVIPRTPMRREAAIVLGFPTCAIWFLFCSLGSLVILAELVI